MYSTFLGLKYAIYTMNITFKDINIDSVFRATFEKTRTNINSIFRKYLSG